MKKTTLAVQKRDLFGKKLKKIRREGLIPANIFGPDFKSTSISVNLKDFLKVYRTEKETGVIHLELDKKEIPTLIKYLQLHPVTDKILHVDFRKIDLTKKILTEVPVKPVGVSEAVSQKGGILLVQTNTLSIEALPNDIPSEIEVDISAIKDIGGEIKTANLAKSAKYEIKTPSDKVIVSVVAHKEESITPDTVSAVPEVTSEKPDQESAETAPAADDKTSKEAVKTKPEAKEAKK